MCRVQRSPFFPSEVHGHIFKCHRCLKSHNASSLLGIRRLLPVFLLEIRDMVRIVEKAKGINSEESREEISRQKKKRESFTSLLLWFHAQISLPTPELYPLAALFQNTCSTYISPYLYSVFLFSLSQTSEILQFFKALFSANCSSVPPILLLCSIPPSDSRELITPTSWFPHHGTMFLRQIKLLSRCITVNRMCLSPCRL